MSFRKRDVNAAYTIGYSLVYFMMSRESTEKVLRELLWEFKKHGQDANSIRTINEHYPGGFEKLERNWRKWIPRARPYRPLRALRKGDPILQKDGKMGTQEAAKAKKDSASS
ncbi:hypothetical protein ES703_59306 [subsurface metagenome]